MSCTRKVYTARLGLVESRVYTLFCTAFSRFRLERSQVTFLDDEIYVYDDVAEEFNNLNRLNMSPDLNPDIEGAIISFDEACWVAAQYLFPDQLHAAGSPSVGDFLHLMHGYLPDDTPYFSFNKWIFRGWHKWHEESQRNRREGFFVAYANEQADLVDRKNVRIKPSFELKPYTGRIQPLKGKIIEAPIGSLEFLKCLRSPTSP